MGLVILGLLTVMFAYGAAKKTIEVSTKEDAVSSDKVGAAILTVITLALATSFAVALVDVL